MKTLQDFHDLLGQALRAIDGKTIAEEHAKSAQQAAANANSVRANTLAKADQLIVDANAKVAARKAELEKAEREHDAKFAAEKAEHDRYVANARAQVETASETLSALQLQISEARKTREQLGIELANLRAAFGEAGKRLADG